MNPKEILNKYWGYPDFRSPQEDIISEVLSGKHCLALMPTGGGKSLCFQVPALIKDGFCLVISPLIALMQDQVEQLNKRGIKAAAIYSGMNRNEVENTLNNAIYGAYKLLYVSPERVQTEFFKSRIPHATINLIAVDEAHCISQWGYDFRPAYTALKSLREASPSVPILALTASATPRVA